MATVDHATIQEWLQREMDGDLTPDEQRRLTAQLDSDESYRQERTAFHELRASLERERIAVRDGFAEQVMAGLPPAAWEQQDRRVWAVPFALLLALGAASASLLSFGGRPGGSFFGLAASLVELCQVTLVAGAGLLTQSWAGLRLAIGEAFAASPASVVGVALLVVGLNLLFFRNVRRRRMASVRERGDG